MFHIKTHNKIDNNKLDRLYKNLFIYYKFENNITDIKMDFNIIENYIKKYDMKIPEYLEKSHKSKNIASFSYIKNCVFLLKVKYLLMVLFDTSATHRY